MLETKIRELRLAHGMDQATLAALVGANLPRKSRQAKTAQRKKATRRK